MDNSSQIKLQTIVIYMHLLNKRLAGHDYKPLPKCAALNTGTQKWPQTNLIWRDPSGRHPHSGRGREDRAGAQAHI